MTSRSRCWRHCSRSTGIAHRHDRCVIQPLKQNTGGLLAQCPDLGVGRTPQRDLQRIQADGGRVVEAVAELLHLQPGVDDDTEVDGRRDGAVVDIVWATEYHGSRAPETAARSSRRYARPSRDHPRFSARSYT